MTGLVRFLLFASVIVGALIFLVVPIVAGPLATGLLGAAGVRGEQLETQVEGNGLALLTGRASRVRMGGQNVELRGLRIGDVDLTVENVSLIDRSFERIDGTLQELRMATRQSGTVTVAAIRVSGPARQAEARGHLEQAETEKAIKAAARGAGVEVRTVQLQDGQIALESAGGTVDASLEVRDGGLVIGAGSQVITLVERASDDPFRLTDASVSSNGVTIEGVIDAQRLVNETGAAP